MKGIERRLSGARAIVLAAALSLGGCHTRAVSWDIALRPSETHVCARGVRVVRDSSALPLDAIPVAEITTWRPADAAYQPDEDVGARRKKAGRLGANLLLLRHDPAVHTQATLPSHASLALFAPSESRRVSEACNAN